MKHYAMTSALAILALATGLGSTAHAQYYPPVTYYSAPAPAPFVGSSYSFYTPRYSARYYAPRYSYYAPTYSSYYAPAYAGSYSVRYGPLATRVRYYNPGPYYYTPAYSYTPGYYSYYYTPGYFRY
ncbi:MAG TPA: hypothetical protein VG013_18955 [Gemmataceae bacterium]|jgi:hypothetical protein|nr:hypothetical protein [Gemmataceae bacterium]